MGWIDYSITGIICLSAIISLVRGFVREAFSLVAWGCAFYISSRFYPYLAAYFTGFHDELVRNGVAISVLFIATLIVGGIVSYTISQLVIRTGLSGTDRLLGVCFGVLRGVLIVSALLFFLDTFTQMSQSEQWQESQLIPQFRHIIIWFFDYLKNTSDLLRQ